MITSGLVEPVGGFFSTKNRPESPLHGQQVPTFDLSHRPPLDPFVLILFIHKLFKPRQELPLPFFGGVVKVRFHLPDRSARQLTIPLFALFLSKPLLAFACQKQGEGSSRIRILAELLDDGEPGYINVLIVTDRLDDLIELLNLPGERVFGQMALASIGWLCRSRWLCGDLCSWRMLMGAEGRFDSFLQVLKGLIDGFVSTALNRLDQARYRRSNSASNLGRLVLDRAFLMIFRRFIA